MNGVIGMTSLLADTHLTPEQSDYVRIVRDSGQALLSVINDILDFSKIDAGHIELDETDFDPIELVEAAIQGVAQAASARQLEILLLTEGTIPAVIQGDPLRLRQVIANLLSNAVKFTEAGNVQVTLRERPSPLGRIRLGFEFSDTGIGIPQDRLEAIFDAFAQVDASTTRRFGGTGLGLPICRELVRRMGGVLTVQSREGEGSAFHFELEFARSPEHPAPDILPDEMPRVLLIEDDPDLRRMLRSVLAGLVVLETQPGPFGAAPAGEATSAPPDAVLLGSSCDSDPLKSLGLMRLRYPAAAIIRLGRLGEPNRSHFDGFVHRPIRRDSLRRLLLSETVASGGPNGEDKLPASRTARPAGREDRQPMPPASPPLPKSSPDPVGSRAASKAAEAVQTTPVGGRETIRVLLVEDNSVNQKVAIRMLAKLGYETDLAENGRQAVDMVLDQPYDLVLMDVQMPVMDGLEATGLIRKGAQSASGPFIVAMTANASSEDRSACLNAGMDDYLPKPIKLQDLESLMGRVRMAAISV
jgi:CheY-like chemotaxis protein